MNKSDSINELATALSKAQGEIENAAKSSENPHFRSKYADLAEVINCIRPVFSKHGLAFTQFVSYDAGIVSVETVLMHSGGQWLSGVISAPVSKQDAQGVGSATTYCRRYSLAAVAGLAQEDDDANAAVGHGKVQPAASQATNGQGATADRHHVNERIRHSLHNLGCNTAEEAQAMTEKYTAFTGRDKKEVPGKRDYKALSDAAAKILADKLEKMHADKRAEVPELCELCRQPMTDRGCQNPDCSNGPF
jgi:hypothetical protein